MYEKEDGGLRVCCVMNSDFSGTGDVEGRPQDEKEEKKKKKLRQVRSSG